MKKLENIAYKAFCLLIILCVIDTVSFAQSGKNLESITVYANDNDSTGNLTHLDSIIVDVDLENEVEVDDTLVFEDWEEVKDKREWVDSSELELKNLVYDFISEDNSEESADGKDRSPVQNRWNNALDVQVTLYPNPAVNALHIQADIAPITLRIIDIAGKEYIISNFAIEVNITELPIGTYVIQLIYKEHVESRKFIKY